MPSVGEIVSLAERIRKGDLAAETELVHQFRQRIFVMGVVRTRDREIARDLVQDTLLAIITALRKGQLLDQDKLSAFVHGTARNIINNHLRSQAQRPPFEGLQEDLAQIDSANKLEESERTRFVQEALAGMRRQDREILQMTLVDGKKPGEIAAILGLTPEVVRTRKLRASKKIAELVEKKMSRR